MSDVIVKVEFTDGDKNYQMQYTVQENERSLYNSAKGEYLSKHFAMMARMLYRTAYKEEYEKEEQEFIASVMKELGD